MCAYQDQSRRCQALSRTGKQCRNCGTAYHPLNEHLEALLCPEHQRAAREGCLRLTAVAQEAVDLWHRIQEANEHLPARTYFVAVDRTLADGRRVIGIPVSPDYATPEQAREALARLRETYPDARVIRSDYDCDSDAQRDTAMADVVHPGEEVSA